MLDGSNAPQRYGNVSTELLLTLVDIPNLVSKPLIVAELVSRGADRRQINRRIVERAEGNPGRRTSDRAAVAQP